MQDFSNDDLAVIPLWSRLVAMVQGLGSTVKTLFFQVAALSLKLSCAQHNDTPQPLAQSTAVLEATIRDLGARVSTLAAAQPHPTRETPQQHRPAPPPAKTSAKKTRKKTLVTHLSPLTVNDEDSPICVAGKWDGDPERFSRKYPDSVPATIYWPSQYPNLEAVMWYSD